MAMCSYRRRYLTLLNGSACRLVLKMWRLTRHAFEMCRNRLNSANNSDTESAMGAA